MYEIPKQKLTVGDICMIEEIPNEKQQQEKEAAKKEAIAVLIKKSSGRREINLTRNKQI